MFFIRLFKRRCTDTESHSKSHQTGGRPRCLSGDGPPARAHTVLGGDDGSSHNKSDLAGLVNGAPQGPDGGRTIRGDGNQ
ncbi:hypothetical protein NQZ68_005682 [Dissostichus eleginoides]|uniref:Ubiquitin carboxyl-terminal hydrolase 16 n=1 Tax=Dissostichus eleginoides TaxID=100907 RepID=A0AAD9B5C8_DISEL|nr:hypothetical protein NQZ68_005682 [Dissostichus eleginoides]KAK1877545.1 Ubiquitin carboxyl-terminal hydrolase 16 [Dissostichus eleginoides]